MAKCCYCRKEINYLEYILGGFSSFFTNVVARRHLAPIITCPHCGKQCKESAGSFYGYIFLFIVFLIMFIKVTLRMEFITKEDDCIFLIALAIGLVGNMFWWRFVSKTTYTR